LLLAATNREIARNLSISEKTVKRYMTTLMQKLKARNRVEVAILTQKYSAKPDR
jgi:DNA-binding NarL/FixJ family response regulator